MLAVIHVPKWDYLKQKLTEHCKVYGKTRAQEKKKQYVECLYKIDQVKEKLFKTPTDPIALRTLENVILEQKEYLIAKTAASRFRSKCRWAREGEKEFALLFRIGKK